MNRGPDGDRPDYRQSSTAGTLLQRSRQPRTLPVSGNGSIDRVDPSSPPRRITPRQPRQDPRRRGPSLPLRTTGRQVAAPDAPSEDNRADVAAAPSLNLSIVIVHWNVAHLLAGCLRSVMAEVERSGLSTAVFVVDSASPDRRYRDVVRGFSGVELLELHDNRGYAAGCNAGIRHRSSEAVLLLNPDTELLPGSLRTLWTTLQVAPHVAMTAPLLLNSDGSIQSAGYRFPGATNVLFDLFPLPNRLFESPLNGRVPVGDGVQPIRIDYPLGAAILLRRSALDAVGFLDESYEMYSEEIDLAHRLAGAGWTTLLAPTARVVHHGGQSTGQRPDAMHEALWLSRAAYFARFGTTRQRSIIAALVAVGLLREDRNATVDRRSSNARIRQRFRQIASER